MKFKSVLLLALVCIVAIVIVSQSKSASAKSTSSTSYLYVFAANGDWIIFSPVTSFSDGYELNHNGFGSVIGSHDPTVLKWKDKNGRLHTHYLSAGQIVHISAEKLPTGFAPGRPRFDCSK